MEGLSLDNIFGEQEISTLFDEPESSETQETQQEVETTAEEKKENETETTEEENSEELFGDALSDHPEGVGSGKGKGNKEEPSSEKGEDTSPQNFYSSIANALAEDGIFPNLDEETVSKAVDADSFSELIEAEINARLDEKQQRISKALEQGVEPDAIRRYESTLDYLAGLTEAAVAEESEKGENLRRQLIYQDYCNRGMSPEKAQKLTERSIDAGNDIDDAKEALQSNKEFFQGQYKKLLKEAEVKAEEEKAQRVKEASKLKDSMLKDKSLMGNMELSSDVRKKAYDAVSKPVYKDPETGEYLTAIQKYEMDNHSDFIKYVGLFYTLTGGFKDFKSFTKGEVAKEVKKGLRELEQKLRTTRSTTGSEFKMVTSAKEDPESTFIGGNFRLAL